LEKGKLTSELAVSRLSLYLLDLLVIGGLFTGTPELKQKKKKILVTGIFVANEKARFQTVLWIRKYFFRSGSGDPKS
jgi:hypothetical protein